MTRFFAPSAALAMAGLLFLALAADVFAQSQPQRQTARLPDAFQGLGVSSDQPIQFEAQSLEVREQERVAIFSGNVVVRQNQTVLKTAKLVVYYAGEQAKKGVQQVRRLDADGKVLVTSGNQTASGDKAVFDTEANTIAVTGNVVLTQGENVIRGSRLVINIASGQARMDGGRIQMLIEPRSLKPSNG